MLLICLVFCVLFFLFCVVFVLCLLFNVTSVSGLAILDCPFSILKHLFRLPASVFPIFRHILLSLLHNITFIIGIVKFSFHFNRLQQITDRPYNYRLGWGGLINDKVSSADRPLVNQCQYYCIYIITICILLMRLHVAFADVNLSPDSISTKLLLDIKYCIGASLIHS